MESNPVSQPWAIAVFDIDGVVRDVSRSYRRALADTVDHFTDGGYRPTPADIDRLKGEGQWNNDWKASEELIYRYYEAQGRDRNTLALDYETIVAFFQVRYRGQQPDVPSAWDGYICDEPLLMSADYLQALSADGVAWGFFSGATPASARFVLEQRVGINPPVLIAMGDAPDKPNPTGLITAAQRLASDPQLPTIYAGDTVADMLTVWRARYEASDRPWYAVGVLPPHLETASDRDRYAQQLTEAGADCVVEGVEALTSDRVKALLS
ncbi:TIGR01548 family HAD-type hydrolase [Synechococcus elongatus]|uniref:TIGR01548 family HAD-type hydrolase n=1 Tax=Synechococcus elongatus PCC 11801 TaxID=2219813 RepID=A0AAQ3REK9_SYNEL